MEDMSDLSTNPEITHNRSNSVQLRTFIVIRWVAIIGQIIAITVSVRYYDLHLNLLLCFAVIGVSIITNLTAMYAFPEIRRLSEKQLMLMLLFDITQLAILLFLTGGLHNPFSLLILVPVAISSNCFANTRNNCIGSGNHRSDNIDRSFLHSSSR